MKKLNKNLIQLVKLLSDGAFHDGSSMGDELNMTRSAIWKTIHKLTDYGISIESVKGKGYKMTEPLLLLDSQKIKSALPIDMKSTINLHTFEKITSTNDFLKQQASSDKINICIAEQQTQGKGRLARQWHSPFGRNIYLSCRYRFRKDLSELAGLSLVVSLAIVKTLQAVTKTQKLWVKWPNDIIFQHQKLAGCLIEILAESNHICDAIIGIGINVNMMTASEDTISQPWTSLQNICGHLVDRNPLIATLITHLITTLRQFEDGNLQEFLPEWQTVDLLANQITQLKCGEIAFTGKVCGINDYGHLLLQMSDGNIRAFSSGDTSVVKQAD